MRRHASLAAEGSGAGLCRRGPGSWTHFGIFHCISLLQTPLDSFPSWSLFSLKADMCRSLEMVSIREKTFNLASTWASLRNVPLGEGDRGPHSKATPVGPPAAAGVSAWPPPALCQPGSIANWFLPTSEGGAALCPGWLLSEPSVHHFAPQEGSTCSPAFLPLHAGLGLTPAPRMLLSWPAALATCLPRGLQSFEDL